MTIGLTAGMLRWLISLAARCRLGSRKEEGMHLSELVGLTFGPWKVASVHAVETDRPWVWLVRVTDPDDQVGLSLRGLIQQVNDRLDWRPSSPYEEARTLELADRYGW